MTAPATAAPLPLPCILCEETLNPAVCQPETPIPADPVDAVVFTAHGQYGSCEFDPADGSYLLINVCDRCLRVRARPEFGAVWHAKVTQQPAAVVFSRPFVPDAEPR